MERETTTQEIQKKQAKLSLAYIAIAVPVMLFIIVGLMIHVVWFYIAIVLPFSALLSLIFLIISYRRHRKHPNAFSFKKILLISAPCLITCILLSARVISILIWIAS